MRHISFYQVLSNKYCITSSLEVLLNNTLTNITVPSFNKRYWSLTKLFDKTNMSAILLPSPLPSDEKVALTKSKNDRVMTQQDNYYDWRSARLRRLYLSRAPSWTGQHEVLPCLTLAFETIDKARLRNSLAEYVTHLPRMINLSGRAARGLGREDTYDEIVRGQTDVVKRAVPFLSSHREYAEKSMPLARTCPRNRVPPVVPREKLIWNSLIKIQLIDNFIS